MAEAWLPHPRLWAKLSHSITNDENFTVMTYNILADTAIANCGHYTYVKEGYINMKDRHPRIMKEIEQFLPDILCLQEVEPKHLQENLKPDLEKMGYSCTSDSLQIFDQVTFYQSKRFSLESSERLLLHDAFINQLQDGEFAEYILSAIKKYIRRDTEIDLAKLRCRKSEKVVNIANVHIIWEYLEHVAVQLAEVCAGLRTLLEFAGGERECFIYTGDFNSPPFQTHLSYSYLEHGHVTKEALKSLLDREGVQVPETEFTDVYNTAYKIFRHDFDLKNAYVEVKGRNPEATNCDPVCKEGIYIGCLDYLWYSGHSLGVCGVLDTPDASLLQEEVALPSTKFPSDHIFVMADFYFK